MFCDYTFLELWLTWANGSWDELVMKAWSISLRKHAYSNISKISPPKTENFQIKNSDIFHISAQNTDCGYSLEPPRWDGSNEYPQSMFMSRNMKNNVYPYKPQIYYIKVGFKWGGGGGVGGGVSKLCRHAFVMFRCLFSVVCRPSLFTLWNKNISKTSSLLCSIVGIGGWLLTGLRQIFPKLWLLWQPKCPIDL